MAKYRDAKERARIKRDKRQSEIDSRPTPVKDTHPYEMMFNGWATNKN
ncbi:hypothetical protein [uncultured Arcobacter sp.]|nr:hypothetical protein [uncultured Arcobacter sp.]